MMMKKAKIENHLLYIEQLNQTQMHSFMKDSRDKQTRQTWKLLVSCSLGDAEGKMEIKFDSKPDAERALAELKAKATEFGNSIQINDSKLSSKKIEVFGIHKILDQKIVEAKLAPVLEDGVSPKIVF